MLLTAALLLAPLSLDEEAPAWGGFRGTDGSGVATGAVLPAALDPEGNLMWRVELPAGYSSPTVAGERVFVTGAAEKELLTLALDRWDGTELWRSVLGFDGQRPGMNSPAAPSPATDGERVFCVFHHVGLVAYDAASGKELWKQELGPFTIPHGMSTSPVVHDGVVLLQVDQDTDPYLVAFDAKSGKQRWKVARPGMTHSYATPAIHAPEKGPAQLIVSGSFQISGYAIATGEKLWWVDGSAWQSKSVPVVHGNRVYVNAFMQAPTDIGLPRFAGSFADLLTERDENENGVIDRAEWKHDFLQQAWFIFDLDDDDVLDEEDWEYAVACGRAPGGLFAIRLDGRGDVTKTHVTWKSDDRRALPDLSSPVVVGDALFLVKDGGLFSSVDLATGEVIKQGRVAEPDSYPASPVAAGGRILLTSHSGQLVVVDAKPQWEVASVHRIDEETWSTPALAGGQVFVRTQEALYCFEDEAGD